MVVYKNNYIRTLLSLLIILVMLFNFTMKPYAEPMTISLVSLKVLAFLASALGIMVFIQEHGGLEVFRDAFESWLSTTKQINNIREILFQLLYLNITSKAKVGISEVGNWIKEFFTTEYAPELVLPTLPSSIPRLENADFIKESYTSFQLGPWSYTDIDPNLQIQSNYGILSSYYNSIPIDDNYSIVYGLYCGSSLSVVYPVFAITYNGSLISGVKDSYESTWRFGYNNFNSGIKFINALNISGRSVTLNEYINIGVHVQMDTKTGANIVTFITDHVTSGVRYQNSAYNAIAPLINTMPNIETDTSVIPKVNTLPSTANIPWTLGLDTDISGYVGKTVDDILTDVANVPITTYTDIVMSYPGTQLLDLPVPQIEVDSEGVITDAQPVDIPYPDTIPGDVAKGVGLLGSILAFLVSMFEIPDDINLDFEPLKNLDIKDKFPFCLPWDLAKSFNLLVHPNPTPPRFEVPIVTETVVIDLAEFESLATIARTFNSVIFIVALIMNTRRFIGGA